jgi:hypothetical protein
MVRPNREAVRSVEAGGHRHIASMNVLRADRGGKARQDCDLSYGSVAGEGGRSTFPRLLHCDPGSRGRPNEDHGRDCYRRRTSTIGLPIANLSTRQVLPT